MDISIILSISAIFLPLIFSLFLFAKRITLSCVDKKVLNTGLVAINAVSFTLFACLYLLIRQAKTIKLDYCFFNADKICLDFGLLVDNNNIIFLLFAALIFFLSAIFSKLYFEKKKQFIFTKQRYYIFFSLLIFNTYIFLCSTNLLQSLIFYTLQGVIIFLFSYFDIFKNNANFNITRFFRIDLTGSFFFLAGSLMLFKNMLLSKAEIADLSIDISDIKPLTDYCFNNCSALEFKAIIVMFFVAIAVKLLIFPFSCYYSFFANSSNVLYFSIIGAINTSCGVYLFTKFAPCMTYCKEIYLCVLVFGIVTVLSSLVFLLFEKNIKIIFGYVFSILNALFLMAYIHYSNVFVLLGYFAIYITILFVLAKLFINDVISLNKRIVNKRKGFLLEGFHIIFFETLPDKIFQLISFIDEKIIQNIFIFAVALINWLVSLIYLKTIRNSIFKSIRSILVLIALFIIVAIIAALFGGSKC